MSERYPFDVWTKEDYEDLPKGSHISVRSEDEENYMGWHSFMCTTWEVVVPKNICRKKSSLEKTLDKSENGN